jgi:hypothetical protein
VTRAMIRYKIFFIVFYYMMETTLVSTHFHCLPLIVSGFPWNPQPTGKKQHPARTRGVFFRL